ncbi:flavodoxin family protein [Bacillus smithii]|uniref:NADPH-dependent FMN reductase-like domain-containing protein n=1 Tax=Bacillus smithii 7_3_47FAA TaxID=665952 RepID=G9QJV1_9BACI|nr:flavodoxin family protein [Bacillus smithii]EHL78540.1 hypothetical protein HMPREF1015_01490 [Bacillus smithii 7_3_47FAA]
MSIAVIYGRTRPNGNTEILTNRAIEGLEAERIYLNEYDIRPIVDGRHADEGFPKVNDDYNKVLDRILPHDILIFATPVYWYSMSGTMKNFIDRWSQTLRDPEYPDFKAKMAEKEAYVIAVGGDHPTLKALPLVQQFQHIFDFMGIAFKGYILGEGNKPGDILQDPKALSAADQLRESLKKN